MRRKKQRTEKTKELYERPSSRPISANATGQPCHRQVERNDGSLASGPRIGVIADGVQRNSRLRLRLRPPRGRRRWDYKSSKPRIISEK